MSLHFGVNMTSDIQTCHYYNGHISESTYRREEPYMYVNHQDDINICHRTCTFSPSPRDQVTAILTRDTNDIQRHSPESRALIYANIQSFFRFYSSSFAITALPG